MALLVERINGKYMVDASPPHVKRPWKSRRPRGRYLTEQALSWRGARVEDIVQLLHEVDVLAAQGKPARAKFD